MKEEEHTSKEVPKGAEGDGGQGEHGGVAAETEVEVGQGAGVGPGAGAGAGARDEVTSGGWQEVSERTSPSPKQPSPLLCVAVTGGLGTSLLASQKSPSPKGSNTSSNGAPVWQGTGCAASAKSPPKKSPTPTSTGFGFMPKENRGDDQAISSAFKK